MEFRLHPHDQTRQHADVFLARDEYGRELYRAGPLQGKMMFKYDVVERAAMTVQIVRPERSSTVVASSPLPGGSQTAAAAGAAARAKGRKRPKRKTTTASSSHVRQPKRARAEASPPTYAPVPVRGPVPVPVPKKPEPKPEPEPAVSEEVKRKRKEAAAVLRAAASTQQTQAPKRVKRIVKKRRPSASQSDDSGNGMTPDAEDTGHTPDWLMQLAIRVEVKTLEQYKEARERYAKLEEEYKELKRKQDEWFRTCQQLEQDLVNAYNNPDAKAATKLRIKLALKDGNKEREQRNSRRRRVKNELIKLGDVITTFVNDFNRKKQSQ